MEQYSDYEIVIPNGRYTGEVAVKCPQCSHDRKKKDVKCLSVNLDKKVWKCHHCDWSGGLRETLKEYVRPTWSNSTSLNEKVVKWFEARGLKQETVIHFKIQNGTEFMPQVNANRNAIMFPYFKNGVCVNIKYRDAEKNFKMHKGSELSFFNIDVVSQHDEIYITEGELDAMALHQCGFPNVISVPNGASAAKNNMVYIDNCFELLEGVKKFFIATDNDVAGRRLRHDLLERLGADKCQYVVFKDCKDANDCLIKYGQAEVALSCHNKLNFPIEGAFTMEDFGDEVKDYYENGLPKGDRVGMPKTDKLMSFHKGYLTVITGIPGHGKSSVLDQFVLMLTINCGWKGAFYSPENRPTKLHISKLIRLITGKHWEGQYKMDWKDVETCMEYLNEKIFFIKPEKDFTLDSILKSAANLKARYGTDFFVIDAWNKLEHKDDKTTYIGEQLDKISEFCDRHQMMCFLVAHPIKMKKAKDKEYYEVPTLYDIAGSAHFFNKADLGICVYRNFEDKKVTVIVQKVKFNHWGETGAVEYEYDFNSGRFYEDSKIGKYAGNWMFKKDAYREDVFTNDTMRVNINNVNAEPELKFNEEYETKSPF